VNKLLDRILMGVVVALAATLIWVVAGTLQAPVVNAGDKAPDFTLVTDRGRTITPASFGGKLLVLNFWASWCGPCLEEEPSLQAFQRAYASKGVVVVGVSADRIDKNYHAFLDRFQIGFDTWRDPEGEAGLAARYGTVQFPETYVIDTSGRVIIKVPDPQDFTDPDFTARIEKSL
jgi:cytochrome c biogenesis protein CcmG, thiol:disulfide interchange protein DsbE